jgi:hypothetical protein
MLQIFRRGTIPLRNCNSRKNLQISLKDLQPLRFEFNTFVLTFGLTLPKYSRAKNGDPKQ